MADPGAGIYIVVAEACADQLLDQVGLFVRAARGRDAADGIPAVLGLDALELTCRMADRLVPADLAPRIGDLGPDHRLGDAVLVGRIAPGEAALDAGMAVVGLATLVRRHAQDLVALHLGLEGAADAAITAGGDHAASGLAGGDHRFLDQGRRRASLDAGPAGDAFGSEEAFVLAGRDVRGEAAPVDGQ